MDRRLPWLWLTALRPPPLRGRCGDGNFGGVSRPGNGSCVGMSLGTLQATNLLMHNNSGKFLSYDTGRIPTGFPRRQTR